MSDRDRNENRDGKCQKADKMEKVDDSNQVDQETEQYSPSAPPEESTQEQSNPSENAYYITEEDMLAFERQMANLSIQPRLRVLPQLRLRPLGQLLERIEEEESSPVGYSSKRKHDTSSSSSGSEKPPHKKKLDKGPSLLAQRETNETEKASQKRRHESTSSSSESDKPERKRLETPSSAATRRTAGSSDTASSAAAGSAAASSVIGERAASSAPAGMASTTSSVGPPWANIRILPNYGSWLGGIHFDLNRPMNEHIQESDDPRQFIRNLPRMDVQFPSVRGYGSEESWPSDNTSRDSSNTSWHPWSGQSSSISSGSEHLICAPDIENLPSQQANSGSEDSSIEVVDQFESGIRICINCRNMINNPELGCQTCNRNNSDWV